MLRYGHVEEYKDFFLQVDQNNGIKTYFTDGKEGVAREVNHALLERFGICCLMHRWTNYFGLKPMCMLVIS